MTNDIINFLQRLAEAKHGSLERARFSISRNEVNCRCPYCMDSQRNSRKRRFYFTLKDNLFYCHNCGRKGSISKLLNDFKNIPHVNYPKLIKDIGIQNVEDFIEGNSRLQEQKIEEKRDWVLEFPDGARLDRLFVNKDYKRLPNEDKVALLKVVRYLQSRGVKKEWYHYFYFVFPGEEHDQYILTLFEYNGNWVWSGRKIDTNRDGPKYLHLPNFPFHLALGFANEVSTIKSQTLYVVESWFSALLLNQEKLNAVCVFGLQNMKYDNPVLDPYRKKYKIVWIPDNDETFSQFCQINSEFMNCMDMIKVPTKDVADYVVQEGDKFKRKFSKLIVDKISGHALENVLIGL